MVMMPELEPVTDPTERARLARWVVALRRAYAAGVGQTTGKLHHRMTQLDQAAPRNTFCCLGIQCVLDVAAGTLAREENASSETGTVSYGPAGTDPAETLGWTSGAMPSVAHLAGSSDPDLLKLISAEGWSDDLEEEAESYGYVHAEGRGDVESFVEAEAKTHTAAELNDDFGLNFGQIADIIAWRFELTAEELAQAEAAPRVPEVEGPEPEAKAG
jgi:hypothetical protein